MLELLLLFVGPLEVNLLFCASVDDCRWVGSHLTLNLRFYIMFFGYGAERPTPILKAKIEFISLELSLALERLIIVFDLRNAS